MDRTASAVFIENAAPSLVLEVETERFQQFLRIELTVSWPCGVAASDGDVPRSG